MKNKETIIKQIEWCKKALYDEDNQSELMQIKLYTQLDTLNWVIRNENK